jgi:hypothetical protein
MREVRCSRKLTGGASKFYYHVEWYTDCGYLAKLRAWEAMLSQGLVKQTQLNQWKFEVIENELHYETH